MTTAKHDEPRPPRMTWRILLIDALLLGAPWALALLLAWRQWK
jgi:hypothetical protein